MYGSGGEDAGVLGGSEGADTDIAGGERPMFVPRREYHDVTI